MTLLFLVFLVFCKLHEGAFLRVSQKGSAEQDKCSSFRCIWPSRRHEKCSLYKMYWDSDIADKELK